ncbi:MAG: glucose-6-phosphate isomerase [Eggerthellaceae bacterium]|jgi:glucose-6-phosphate isomerase|nr:glucose-6-phosphate isomerase [Eggerthellaceae bacterium]MCH4221408.1 glucose-6-phosphate isomerase [Eggerthellaceae bacterium]
MLSNEMEKVYPSAKMLVKDQVASRLHDKDDSLFDFEAEAQKCAANFMGWTDLASNPPTPVEDIQTFADEVLGNGLKTVLLIGQGGSTQAPMTITKYNKVDSSMVSFKTLDSDSPVRVRTILAEADPETMLVVVSSKSGGTIEPRLALSAVRSELSKRLSEEEIVHRLVAVTDPGSNLEKKARREGWRAVFSGEPKVGGRYSALSVFGLLPAALVGINLHDFIGHALDAERHCSEDSIDNPAIQLAAFLYDNYQAGRDKFSFLTPKRGRVLGLWIEQLVAESLGKGGRGILPNIELDTLLLTRDRGDRCVITYQTKTDLWDERKNFEMSLAYMDTAIPRANFKVENACELAEHFVMWEYAVAMCGYLMKVCPFDQPDVAAAKAAVLDILDKGKIEPDFTQDRIGSMQMGQIEVRMSGAIKGATDLEGALSALFESIRPGDYFALNAFLPFTGEGRREALELIRHTVADRYGVASCLEVGPRYLHSTGQLQKGGPNNGVFLIVSADELKDIPLEGAPAPSLATLAKAQAEGDLLTLSQRGRRCLHLHLPDNSGVTLRQLGEVVQKVASER